MKIKYYFNDDEFLYEPAYEDVENAIVNFMIEDCENVFTNCDKVGAEQMAKFVVYRLDLFDGFDFDDIDLLIDKIRYLSKARDCKVIVLDHITMVAEGSEENTTAKLNKLMAELKKIAVSEGLIILSACHLRKSANASKTHEEGGHVTLDDLKSASSIKQLSDIVIGLERNSQDSNKTKANTTLLRVLKNRDFGVKGPAAAVIYDTETTRLQEISLEEFEDDDE